MRAILVEPVAGTKAYAMATEAQAMGRAHRQDGKDRGFVRFLIRDTAEQSLHVRNCIDNGELKETPGRRRRRPRLEVIGWSPCRTSGECRNKYRH